MISLPAGQSPAGAENLTFTITNRETGEIVYTQSLKPGDVITLTWKNSLYNLDVTETYVVRSYFFEQVSIEFNDPNRMDVPEVKPAEVEDYYHTGDPFKVNNISRPFEKIVFLIGDIGNPKIKIKENIIDLKKKAGFGSSIVMELKKSIR